MTNEKLDHLKFVTRFAVIQLLRRITGLFKTKNTDEINSYNSMFEIQKQEGLNFRVSCFSHPVSSLAFHLYRFVYKEFYMDKHIRVVIWSNLCK